MSSIRSAAVGAAAGAVGATATGGRPNDLVLVIAGAGGADTGAGAGNPDGASNTVASDASAAIQVLGLRSGVTRASYSRGSTGVGGLAVSPSAGGPVLISSQRDKRFMHVWHAGKEAVDMRCAMPERIGPVAVTADGAFLFAGAATSSGKCMVWDLQTGELLNVWPGHLRAVSAMAVTDDDGVLVTGGEDALVHAWRVSDLVSRPKDLTGTQSRVVPLATMQGHSLPVTGLHVGAGGGALATVLTCSLDHSCRVWSLASRGLEGTLTFPRPLSAVAMDALETIIYAGATDGRIFSNPLQPDANEGDHSSGPDAQVLTGHTGRVTQLRVVTERGVLVSTAEDGTVRVWDMMSGQTARVVNTVFPKVAALLVTNASEVMSRRGGRNRRSDAAGKTCIPPLSKFVVRDEALRGDGGQKMALVQESKASRRCGQQLVSRTQQSSWCWPLSNTPGVVCAAASHAGQSTDGEEAAQDKEVKRQMDAMAAERDAFAAEAEHWKVLAGRLAKVARVEL